MEFAIQKKKDKIMYLLAGILCIIAVCLPLPVKAEQTEKTIRVGYFSFPGFQEYDEEGNPYGYNVDYLEEISKYTKWNYEYVPAESWVAAVKMLRNGEIDLLAPAQRTPEREAEFLFPDYSIGTEYGAMMCLDSADAPAYEEYEEFSKLKVGCVASYVMKDEFLAYAEKNGFMPDMVYYPDTNRLLQALKQGEVDAITANYAYATDKTKLLAKFSPSPQYYMVNQEHQEYVTILNEVLDRMKTEMPDWENQLVNQYYPYYTEQPYTKDDEEFVAGLPVIKVGYKIREPLCYRNEQGEDKGILIDIMKLISQRSGIRFEYVLLPNGTLNYDDLQQSGIQIIMGVEHTKVNLSFNEMSITTPFFSSTKVIVGKKGRDFQRNEELMIAIDSGSNSLYRTIIQYYPNAELLQCDNTEEGLQAVLSGEADVLLQSQFAVKNLLQYPRYEQLTIVPGEGLEDDLSLAVPPYAQKEAFFGDGRLTEVLDKAIMQLQEYEVTEIIIAYTAAMPYKVTLEDFWYRYRYALIVIGLVSLCGFLIAAYAVRMHQNNVKLVRKSERQLSGITNNINGGVLVLLPDGGLKIQYANKGFWRMLGEPEDTVAESYTSYIKTTDFEKLNWLLLGDVPEGTEIQLECQMLCSDGSYIPVVFRGTLALEDKKRLLYCVIIDIREQKKIQEQLAEEKERYELILEQSNDIIFDVDIKQKKVLWSPKYEEVFGWSGKEMVYHNIKDNFHIYPEDREIQDKILDGISQGKEAMDVELRIVKKDGYPLWCRVIMHLIYRRGALVRMVGKIADIDQMIKEKIELQHQTRTDSLSGLLNKEAFKQDVQECWEKQDKTNGSVMVFIDIDNFKQLNDTLGHQKGDEALIKTAGIIRKNFRNGDLIGRFGGDEFVAFIPEITLKDFLKKAEKLREELRLEFSDMIGENKVVISASIGFTHCEDETYSYEEMLEEADKALYSAKEQGKDRYVMYHDQLILHGYKNIRA